MQPSYSKEAELDIKAIYFLNVQLAFNINCAVATNGSVNTFDINGSRNFKDIFIQIDDIKAPKIIINTNFIYLLSLLSFLLKLKLAFIKNEKIEAVKIETKFDR